MTSNGEQKLLLKPKTPHFFKIILSHTIREEKLEIPKVYMTKYGSNLQKSVILKVLPNTVWEIGLTKSDNGTVWLYNGWKQFAEYYSLVHGHLLVFKYRGNFAFSVTIFDTTASEIDYPYNSIRDGLIKTEFEMEDSASVEIVDDITPRCKIMQKKSPLPCHLRPRKLARTNSEYNNQRSTEFRCLLPKGKGNGTSIQQLTADEKAVCQEIASGFVSDYPFFVVIMPVSSVCRSNNFPIVTIPSTFTKKYFKKGKDSVTLVNSDGRTWPASYYRTSSRTATKLFHGWKEFAEENHLQVGDVCAFELVSCDKIRLRITVFQFRENEPEKSRVAQIKPGYNCDRADETPSLRLSESDISTKPNIHNSIVQSKGKSNKCAKGLSCSKTLEAAGRLDYEYTTHKFVIKPRNQKRGSVNLPWKFIENLIKRTSVEAAIPLTLLFEERSWPLMLSIYPKYKLGELNRGWVTFSRDNSLQAGDVCVLELIDEDNVRVKVSLLKNG